MFSHSASGMMMGSPADLHEQIEAAAKTPFLFPPGGLSLKSSLGGVVPNGTQFSNVVAALAAQNASNNAALTRHQNFFVSPNACATSNADSLNFEYGGETAEARMVEYRGEKVAGFDIDADVMICLPQAYVLFLKHLVGGLHTVYTKLKRLEITPKVCNVEQVRALRSLGAIQPGVNRCKLISCRDFDSLYNDCSNQSSRPGRPPKRSPVPYSPQSQNAGAPLSFKKLKSEDDLATIEKHRNSRGGDHHGGHLPGGNDGGGGSSNNTDALGVFPGGGRPGGPLAPSGGGPHWPFLFPGGSHNHQLMQQLLQTMNPGLFAKIAAPNNIDLIHGNQIHDLAAHLKAEKNGAHDKEDQCESPGLSGAEESSDCGAVNLSNRNQNQAASMQHLAGASHALVNGKSMTSHGVTSLTSDDPNDVDSHHDDNHIVDSSNIDGRRQSGGVGSYDGEGRRKDEEHPPHEEEDEDEEDEHWINPEQIRGDKPAGGRGPREMEPLDLEGGSSVGDEDEGRQEDRGGGVECASGGNEVNYFGYVSELMTFLQSLLKIANITSQNQLEHLQNEKWELWKKLHDAKVQKDKIQQELQQLKREKSIYRARWHKEKRMRLDLLTEITKSDSPSLENASDANNTHPHHSTPSMSGTIQHAHSPSKIALPRTFHQILGMGGNSGPGVLGGGGDAAIQSAMTSLAAQQVALASVTAAFQSPPRSLAIGAATPTPHQLVQNQQQHSSPFGGKSMLPNSSSSPSTPVPPGTVVPSSSAPSNILSPTQQLIATTNSTNSANTLVTTSHSLLASNVNSFASS